jgi:eukaryotic translation initiation factor 2C
MGALSIVPKNVVWQPGTRGRRIKVEVNYLKLALEKLVNTAYHYDVTFEPDKPKKFLQSALDRFQQKNFPKTGFAFDGRKNAYTSKVLQMKAQEFSDTVTVTCGDTGREKSFKITIKKVNDIDLLPLKK